MHDDHFDCEQADADAAHDEQAAAAGAPVRRCDWCDQRRPVRWSTRFPLVRLCVACTRQAAEMPALAGED